MALIICPECNGKVSDKAKTCPHCGYPISEYINEKNETKNSNLNDAEIEKRITQIKNNRNSHYQIEELKALIEETHHQMAYKELGLVYDRNNMYEEAIRVRQEGIEYNQDDYEAFADIGIWFATIGNDKNDPDLMKKAIEYLKKGVEHYNLKAIVFLAKIYDVTDKTYKIINKDETIAEEYWLKGLDYYCDGFSEDKTAFIIICNNIGVFYQTKLLHIQAACYYHIANTIDPSNDLCKRKYRTCKEVIRSDYGLIWEHYIEQIKTHRDIGPMISKVNQIIRNRMLSVMGDDESLINAYDCNTDYTRLKQQLMEAKHLLKAEDYNDFLDRMIKRTHYGMAYNEKGIYLEAKGEQEKELQSFKEAVVYNPDNAMLWGNLGGCYRHMVNVGNLEYEQDAISSYLNSGKLGRIIGYHFLSNIYNPTHTMDATRNFHKDTDKSIEYGHKGIDLFVNGIDSDKEGASDICIGIGNIAKANNKPITATCYYKLAYIINPDEKYKNIYLTWRNNIEKEFGSIWARNIDSIESYREIETMINNVNDQIRKEKATTKETKKDSINVPHCPTCKSTNVKKISSGRRWLSIGMFGLASSDVGKTFMCVNCGYKW